METERKLLCGVLISQDGQNLPWAWGLQTQNIAHQDDEHLLSRPYL